MNRRLRRVSLVKGLLLALCWCLILGRLWWSEQVVTGYRTARALLQTELEQSLAGDTTSLPLPTEADITGQDLQLTTKWPTPKSLKKENAK